MAAKQLYIAIDPGMYGCVAFLSGKNGPGVPTFIDTPRIVTSGGKADVDPEGMAKILTRFRGSQSVSVAIEHVGVIRGQGIASSGKFMRGFGIWIGILYACLLKPVFVTPQAWKKHWGLISLEKSASIECAKKRWPSVNLARTSPKGRTSSDSHDRADAALMVEYLRVTTT